MIAIVRLLAALLGATSPEGPMSRLLALDEAAFARRVRDRRRPDSAGHNVPGADHARAHAGVSV
ncbi:hypothetical protein ABZ023_35080 [Streptomyces sp. NPDC006367]|uniref:hypothetical protein n=1 Tax=unclassified Streptomyces TaxID=2593676 RepID=UPI0033ADC41E